MSKNEFTDHFDRLNPAHCDNPVTVYASDFDQTLDGWQESAGSVSYIANYDGETDVLIFEPHGTLATHWIYKQLTFVDGRRYRITGKYYIDNPAGIGEMTGLAFYNSPNASPIHRCLNCGGGGWIEFTAEFYAVAPYGIYVYGLDSAGETSFTPYTNPLQNFGIKDIVISDVGVQDAFTGTSCPGLTGRFISSYPIITRIFTTGNNKGNDYVSLTPAFTANLTVQGYNFLNTQKVFLSASDQGAISGGHNIVNPLTAVDLFSSYSGISADFVPFNGFEVTNFTIANDNVITLDVPELSATGIDLHIIAVNSIGHSLPFTEQVGRHPRS